MEPISLPAVSPHILEGNKPLPEIDLQKNSGKHMAPPSPPVFHDAPIFSSYNHPFSTWSIDSAIVVIGDQSAGKSSVLKSLAGISLPRGDSFFKKVTSNKVSIGLGYICVRNRFGDEEALEKEAQLFETHHLLSEISRSMVGIPVLVKGLSRSRRDSFRTPLPRLLRPDPSETHSGHHYLNGQLHSACRISFFSAIATSTRPAQTTTANDDPIITSVVIPLQQGRVAGRLLGLMEVPAFDTFNQGWD
ncbi:interferon-induced GTP-binding protein mx [Striga asiatica]|uniref:Interferon-induced GTP-binding protein mx n=1 Tax=Striga asiatica TaxID=4170 RepID=A0A5A7PJX1_STRAF|nr:interferon-induced GTP-binding protein mx [Striga asiatica]